MAKILKWLTGSSVKSYSLKFALDFMLGNNLNFSEDELGLALQEVIHYRSIEGKFNSVHPDLRAEGVTRIEVGDQGITFHQDQPFGKWLKICRLTKFEVSRNKNLHIILTGG